MKTTLEELLIDLRNRVKTNVVVELKSADTWEKENPWACVLATDRNEYPSWIRMLGKTPIAAVRKMFGFLAGRVCDHASNPRPPSAFLKEKDHV